MSEAGGVTTGRNAGLDLAKGLSILLVVCWHAQLSIPEDAVLVRAAFSFFYNVVTLTAVPLFVTVSLYLFLSKLARKGRDYFRKRMLRLGEVYAFWMLVQTVLSVAATGEWPALTLAYFMSGGPGLPVVSGSVFYFLFDLLILTVLAYGFFLLPQRARVLAAWGVAAASLAYFIASPWTGMLLPNYLGALLVYIPVAYLMHARPELFRKWGMFTALFLMFGAAEMVLHKFAGIDLASPYARLSTFFGVLSIYSLCAAFPLDRPWVRWLAVHSLGIYALHKYFQYLGFQLLLGGLGYSLQTIPLAASLVVFAATVLLTVCAVGLLRRTVLVRYLA